MLVNKEITSVELTEDVLARIDEVEGDVKAYLTITRDEALAQAKAVDEKIARGEERYSGRHQGQYLHQGRKDELCLHGFGKLRTAL